MTIIEKIKQSVEGATGMPFLYHAAGELNELIARCKELPVAYSFLIDSGTIDDVNGRYHERVTLAVMFCDKTEFDFNALENEQIIDRMKVKAYKWMQSLRMSNALRIVAVNNTQRLYDNTTDILTGFAVNITIEDIAGVGECELPQVVIDVDKNGSYDVVGVDKVRVNVVPRLEELEVTQNGEYTPQEGVDGFSRVVAEFDPSSLPKINVSTISISNDCLDEEGTWKEFTRINPQNIRGFTFANCNNLLFLDASEWDTSKITGSFTQNFRNCNSLQWLNSANWDTSNITAFQATFINCYSMEWIDTTSWDMSKVTELTDNTFANCHSLTSLIGNKTIEDVIGNDVVCMKGMKISFALYDTNRLDRASLRALINGLADLTGQTAQTLTIGAILLAKLTNEDIAIATNKNWTIV